VSVCELKLPPYGADLRAARRKRALEEYCLDTLISDHFNGYADLNNKVQFKDCDDSRRDTTEMETRVVFKPIGMAQPKRAAASASAQPVPAKSERLPVRLDCGWTRVWN
jgi:hypothetical protein